MTAPCLFPTLRYRDADASLHWLVETIGFSEHFVTRDDAGAIAHAELARGSSILMIGQAREDAYGRMIGGANAIRRDAIYIAVDDIAPIHERVVASGVEIEMPPYDTPYGSREFMCRDPESNLWSIGTYWPQIAG